MSDLGALIDDLEAEQRALADDVRAIDADAWFTPTPAWGWDVRDTIAHLAHTDEMAVETMHDRPGAINAVAQVSASGPDVTYRGVLEGRRQTGPDVLAWWERASQAERAELTALAPDTRVAWGIGMRAPSFVTARLMETWAHSLDVRAALDIPAADTDRLAHVAWLSTRALPYAYSVAGREPPPGALRVELTLPSGVAWTSGPEDAPNRIRGSASDYCRVFVHRRQVGDTALEAEGDVAVDALAVARAFL
ncbi:MAG TPA: maleylpyruvate isomerase family mycothiol-dependent enzyme [Acidimicrobiia bacterium]|nr:maleylpyruvate isomerase family mycothiol-dependent enzyme [Acidimicrobiia bacterium]